MKELTKEELLEHANGLGFKRYTISDNGLVEAEKPKSFDIREHVFSDHIVKGCHLSNDLCVVFREQSFGFNIKKQDAILIAKALGVTGEDL